MSTVRTLRKPVFGLVAALTAVAVSACASSSSPATAASSPASSGSAALSSAVDTSYHGPNAPYFTTLPQPNVKSGTPFKVGFLTDSGAQPVLLAIQNGAQAEVQKLGGQFIAYDAQLSPTEQAAQLQQLIAQKVNVIIGDPVVPAALEPGIAAAKKAGIPFIGVDGPADETQSLTPGMVTAITHAFDYISYETMKKLAAEHPHATFATMGLAIPVAPLIYIDQRLAYWGKNFGLKYLGQANANSDSPAGYGPAVNAILGKYPDVQIIVTYNDESAVATATTVAAQGKHVFVATPNSGQSIAQPALESGRLDLAYDVPWAEQGTQAVIAAYDLLTKQHLPLPKFINLAGPIVTKATAGQAQWVH
jgi:ribose transport system substrate-binding protein